MTRRVAVPSDSPEYLSSALFIEPENKIFMKTREGLAKAGSLALDQGSPVSDNAPNASMFKWNQFGGAQQ